MAEERVQRRLAAIVSADVVGYSRLMGEDEAGTHATLRGHRTEFIEPLIAQHGGRIVKTMGDGLLLEFVDAIEAVRCSVEFQEGMLARNVDIPDDKKFVFRIGINLSEVIFEDGDIFGDGVNFAARLEGMAEPGGLLVSHTVYESILDSLDIEFADNGERAFKTIANPVRVWSWPRPLPADRQDRKPFVVVTNFDGRNEDEKRLAEDLHDDLAAALSRLTGLEVIVDQRKAEYLIKGGVRLAGSQCRLSAQLIRVEDDNQLWAERFTENAEDPFDALERCVPCMTMSVRRRIASDDAARLSGEKLNESTFEQLLSAAGVSFFTPTKEGWLGGGEIAELALRKDPTNFMALAMSAAGHGMAEFLYGYRQPDEAVIHTAIDRVEQARRQTNQSDMLQCVYSGMPLYGRKRHKEAATAAERSLELNPEYSMGLWSLGAAQVFGGEYANGIETATRSVSVDIRDPYLHLYNRVVGYGYFCAMKFQEAADWFRKADQLAPGLPHNLIGLAASQWHSNDHETGRSTVPCLIDKEPEFRVRDVAILPFRETEVWDRIINGLRASGVSD